MCALFLSGYALVYNERALQAILSCTLEKTRNDFCVGLEMERNRRGGGGGERKVEAFSHAC